MRSEVWTTANAVEPSATVNLKGRAFWSSGTDWWMQNSVFVLLGLEGFGERTQERKKSLQGDVFRPSSCFACRWGTSG